MPYNGSIIETLEDVMRMIRNIVLVLVLSGLVLGVAASCCGSSDTLPIVHNEGGTGT